MNIIVINDQLEPAHRRLLEEKAAQYGYDIYFFRYQTDAMDFDKLEDCEIVYGQANRLLDKLPNLKLLHLSSAGNDHYLNNPKLKSDTILSNASGSYGVSISEHLIMVTLSLLRHFPDYVHYQKNHIWGPKQEQGSIIDSNITILGTGDICSEFAKRVRAFSPKKIIGVNTSGYNNGLFDEVITMDRLDEVLPDTDILVSALPRTPQTTDILNKERFAIMKNSAIVLNVGRGNLIKEEDLIYALNNGIIAGAGLDVFDKEPLEKDNPLWSARNIIITPHVSGNQTIPYTRKRNVEIFIEQLENYCTGKPLINVVDMKKGY